MRNRKLSAQRKHNMKQKGIQGELLNKNKMRVININRKIKERKFFPSFQPEIVPHFWKQIKKEKRKYKK